MEQNYANHGRYIPAYHYVAPVLLLAGTIGSIINLVQSFGDEHRLYNASLIALMMVIMWIVWWFTRAFAVKAQDRVIVLEEKLRHHQLTGKPLHSNLRPSQVIALRFASDEEYPALAQKAAAENLSAKAIKQNIRNWKGDYYRV